MAERPEIRTWRQTTGPRIRVVTVLFGLCLLGVIAQLFNLQVLQYDWFQKKGEAQRIDTVDEPARRGDILDRHGRVLACSVDEDTVTASPHRLKNPAEAAALLCQALGDCDRDEQTKLRQRLSSSRHFAYVRHLVRPDQARRVMALKLEGVELVKEPQRRYPNRELAAHLLGYVGNNEGRAGLEYTYERSLRGTPGKVLLELDAGTVRDESKQAKRKAFNRVGNDPVPGDSLELTIDATLQHFVERELHAGVEENRAVAGAAVVMDPMTGEILAMASEPQFNPNAYQTAPPEALRNRAVQDVYEPGSTLKIVTASAAIEEKVMSQTDTVETAPGTIVVPGRSKPVRESQGHNYGTLAFTDVFVRSSNVGAIKIGYQIGAPRLARYVNSFGFGSRLSPDFRPYENAGMLMPASTWSTSTLASVSMGYEIAVTPLQMASAASAIANGGELVQPRLVRAVIRGGRRIPVERKVLRRVTSQETAADVASIMEAVVARGTGSRAQVPQFTVAGKTGTGQKNENGHYVDAYNVSFVGFVPSHNPALTILVVIDTPRGPNPAYGGVVSAPIFQRIADAALRYLGVPPTVGPAPPVLVARRETPSEITVSGPAAPLTILPASAAASGGQVAVPDLRGMSARGALRVLARLGVAAHVSGDGVVIDQDPGPGVVLEPGASCRVTLGRLIAGMRP
jgi:cell division protein FtsI (penicillin-binding protein 3)